MTEPVRELCVPEPGQQLAVACVTVDPEVVGSPISLTRRDRAGNSWVVEVTAWLPPPHLNQGRILLRQPVGHHYHEQHLPP